MNDHGWVVGYSPTGDGENHAFVWTPDAGEAGITAGALTLPGSFVADGSPLTVVGIKIHGDQFIPGDQFLTGDVQIPSPGFWDPRGRLLFQDSDGDATDVLIPSDRPDESPELLLSDAADEGISVVASGGTTEVLNSFCAGTFHAAMDDGDAAIFTCGSLTARIVAGEIRVELNDGTLVFIPAGTLAEIHGDGSGGWVVEGLEGDPAEVLPFATLETLRADFDALRENGTINGGQHRALTVKVGQIQRLLDRDQNQEALMVLADLKQQVLDLESHGVFSADQRKALVASIGRIIFDLTF